MTTLSFEKISIPGAHLGRDNCLPDIETNSYIHASIHVDDSVCEEDRRLIGQGMISTTIPYLTQDGYDRSREIQHFDGAILENDYLKAVFIPALGGRLWSLYDKKAGRELLYVNTVFQPGNLGLRNAWFSGGVEWNVGIKGHNPLTCSPLFAQSCRNSHGEPVLKMYEYERIRGIVYTLCVSLNADVLLVHTTIENREQKDKYMYWWSNIAVDETPKTRVLAPAKDSLFCYYENGSYTLTTGTLPESNGNDVTYPSQATRSRDFFFKIPQDEKKWVAAVKEDGYGLAQFSDDFLVGRKLFVWGQGAGGRHWNEWLSDNPKPYIEIQAGALHTQLEHFIMPANSTIDWTEGYTAIQGDPLCLHGTDWAAACDEVGSRLKDKYTYLPSAAEKLSAEKPPHYLGSGWGALENMVRAQPISTLSSFVPESLNEEQADWLYLLDNGRLPVHNIQQPIMSYVCGKFWMDRLEKQDKKDWYCYYHLGILCYAAGMEKEAEQYFIQSVEDCENPWALRSLAQLAKKNKRLHAVSEYMLRAITIKNDYLPLLTECAYALIAEERYGLWVSIYQSLQPQLKDSGRLRLLLALCYIRQKEIDKAEAILNKSLVVYDIKEGEYSLLECWIELKRIRISLDMNIPEEQISREEVLAAYPLPWELDYRMD